MINPDPGVAQLKTDLQRHCAAVSNLADAAILRANGSGRAVERQVLSGTLNGILINVIQGHHEWSTPGLDLPFRSIEYGRNGHFLTINFQNVGNFTALLDGRMFLCTVTNEPKDPAEFKMATHAVVGVLSRLREVLEFDARSHGTILPPVPPLSLAEFEMRRPPSETKEPFQKRLASVLGMTS